MSPKIVDIFLSNFNNLIKNVPNGFYDTWNFSETPNTLAHPITLGYIIFALSKIKGIGGIDIDVRLRNGAEKMQPDIVVYQKSGFELKDILMILDFESPNSSDARIIEKDVLAYKKFRVSCPYLIITSLPNKKSPAWRLKYAGEDYWNYEHRGMRDKIRENPYLYWYGFYKKRLKKFSTLKKSVFLININGEKAELERVFS